MKMKTVEEYRLEALARLTPQEWEKLEKKQQEAAHAEERRQQELLRAREGLEQSYRRLYLHRHSISMFLEKCPMLCRDPEGKITSKELCSIYSLWCKGEDILPKSSRSLLLHLKEHADELHLLPVNGIREESGKRVRGFRGIRATRPAEIPQPSSATDATHIP